MQVKDAVQFGPPGTLEPLGRFIAVVDDCVTADVEPRLQDEVAHSYEKYDVV